MGDPLTATVVSGVFALLVALLGIAGAIAAQVIATRRAFEYSLALFERQTAEAQQAREEATRTENHHRFADQKRSTYGRALRLADEVVIAQEKERGARQYHNRTMRTLDKVGDQSESLVQAARNYRTEADEQADQARRLAVELADVVGEIHLLSAPAVRAAAEGLRRSARAAGHVEESQYVEAREKFVDAARDELGVEPV